MIFYETATWSSQIFRFQGTVWSKVWVKWLLIVSYNLAAYYYCVRNDTDFDTSKSSCLGSTLSVLLIFRANTAYSRYWEGRTILTIFFTELREAVALSLVCLQGGARQCHLRWRTRHRGLKKEEEEPEMDHRDRHLLQERVNIIRWSIVLAISMQLSTRILEEGLVHMSLSRETKWQMDYDRYRIRHLVTAQEFRSIDAYVRQLIVPQTLWDTPAMDTKISGSAGLWDSGPPTDGPAEFEVNAVPAMRLPFVVLCRLNQVVANCVNDPRKQNRRWGMPERFATLFIGFSSKLLRCYTKMQQVICTPLPFPYFHLCKTLMFVYFLALPLFIKHELGFWPNVVEHSFLALALLGVDAIAIELENPFGIDDNDLDYFDKLGALEEEVMLFLQLTGDSACKRSFMWVEMPTVFTDKCATPVHRCLALRTQVESDGADPHVVVGGDQLRPQAGADQDHMDEESDGKSDFSDDS